MIVIINAKSFLEIHFFAGFQLTVLENKLTFMKEVAVHTNTRDLFSTNQRNGSEMILVAGPTKSTSRI